MARTKNITTTRKLLDGKLKIQFLAALARIGWVNPAAAEVGICGKTVRREIGRDEEFASLVETAKATYQASLLAEHKKHHKDCPRSIEWALERNDPEQFGKRDPGYATPEMLVALADRLLVALMVVVPVEHHVAMLAVAERVKSQAAEPIDVKAVEAGGGDGGSDGNGANTNHDAAIIEQSTALPASQAEAPPPQ